MHTPISRRTALKASGIAIGLPLLESMHSVVSKRTARFPVRQSFGSAVPRVSTTTSLTTMSTTELTELRDHLSELASGYLERYGQDDIYDSIINSIETINDKLNH